MSGLPFWWWQISSLNNFTLTLPTTTTQIRNKNFRTEMDVMATTPRRIADLLCPEISNSELQSIRRRVYETVVLGQGTGSSAHAASLEDDAKEVPVAARSAKHEIEQVGC